MHPQGQTPSEVHIFMSEKGKDKKYKGISNYSQKNY